MDEIVSVFFVYPLFIIFMVRWGEGFFTTPPPLNIHEDALSEFVNLLYAS